MEPLVNSDNGKTTGIVSYLTIIGWLIAYFGMHQSNKTSLGSYQLRQTLLLHIISTGLWIIMTFVFSAMFLTGGFFSWYYLYRILELALFILWVIGFIGAINAEEKPIPLIGKAAQGMFPGI